MKELRQGKMVEVGIEEYYTIGREIRRNCVLATSDESETLASTMIKEHSPAAGRHILLRPTGWFQKL